MNIFITKKLGDKDYRVCLPFLWLSVVIILSLSIVGLKQNNWSLSPNYYIYCNEVNGCDNVFYNSLSCIDSPYEYKPICTQKFIPYKSSIGEKPSFITANINWITIGLILIFLFFNTVLFNKDFYKSLRLE